MSLKHSISPESIRVRDYDRTTDGHVRYVVEFQLPSENKPKFWSVNRRYSDFILLRQELRHTFPAAIVAPLPGKSDIFNKIYQTITSKPFASHGTSSLELVEQMVSPAHTNTSMIEYRCHAFQLFLRHTFANTRLQTHPVLLRFMYQDGDWTKCLSSPAPGLDFTSAEALVPSSHDNQTAHNPECTNGDEKQSAKNLYIMNPHLLKHRASSLKSGFHHVDVAVKQLRNQASDTHRAHRNISNAICRLASNENDHVVADVLQIMGHELDTYASIMDPAEEEDTDLHSRFSVWENYATSINEAHKAYEQSVHNQNNRQPTQVTPASTSHSFDIPTDTAERSFTRSEPTPQDLSDHLLEGIVLLESTLEADLKTMFRSFALSQFRRAERCRNLWMRILTQLERANQHLSPMSIT